MFIPCSERNGSCYYEFQYCRKEWNLKKILKKGFSFWEKNSLLIHINDDRRFFEIYGEYLKDPNSPDDIQELDPHGPNYYTKEHTFSIIEQIKKDKPEEYEYLIPWLQKAANDYNGFFFLGI